MTGVAGASQLTMSAPETPIRSVERPKWADTVENRKSSSFTKVADINSLLQIGLIAVVNAVRERHVALVARDVVPRILFDRLI